MFTHPEFDRALTMREAARLQSFPDDFTFCGENIRELSALIGSAVPPLLGFRLAQQVVRYLDALAIAKLSERDRKLVPTQQTDRVLQSLEGQEWRCDRTAPKQLRLLK
jgi:DNA (cytosine-5)-methyltransferase 1